MFSPYYALARRRAGPAAADPTNHCAMNVALYGRGRSRWAMTERGRESLERDAQHLRIGPSQWRWDGDCLVIDIDEITAPWPSRIKGTVRVHAPVRYDHPVCLAPGHHWCPIAPAVDVLVSLGDESWSGRGYLDSNQGCEPMESAFSSWTWSRAHLRAGRNVVFYDVYRRSDRDHDELNVGLLFASDGTVSAVPPPPCSRIDKSRWGIARSARSDEGTLPRIERTLTDAPFYARSQLSAQWLGEPVTVMHESLSLVRFQSPWTQMMLPFRMPRRS